MSDVVTLLPAGDEISRCFYPNCALEVGPGGGNIFPAAWQDQPGRSLGYLAEDGDAVMAQAPVTGTLVGKTYSEDK